MMPSLVISQNFNFSTVKWQENYQHSKASPFNIVFSFIFRFNWAKSFRIFHIFFHFILVIHFYVNFFIREIYFQ